MFCCENLGTSCEGHSCTCIFQPQTSQNADAQNRFWVMGFNPYFLICPDSTWFLNWNLNWQKITNACFWRYNQISSIYFILRNNIGYLLLETHVCSFSSCKKLNELKATMDVPSDNQLKSSDDENLISSHLFRHKIWGKTRILVNMFYIK